MFEITASDLLGRKGAIHTNKGIIRTPCFVPVVHPEPSKNLIQVEFFQNKFKVDFIITSSYILRKRFGESVTNLHELTKFQGPIMTDSGAFQSLMYGDINISPESVITYQESIGSDFAVPLDVPISISDSYEIAVKKVEKTIERAKELPEYISSSTTKWVSPIQGGKYLDLVKSSAKKLSQIDIFDMVAIGSVVEIMNSYQYDILVDIIIAAKQFLSPQKPVHLFGAGHPSMFPLIVATGCDSFDSAAYSLYAQEERYLTTTQTFLLSELEEFPCSCPICSSLNPYELLAMTKNDRIRLLAEHNLYVCQAEIMNIRRAITNGSLWNLLESRSRVHPHLRRGFNALKKYSNLLYVNSPSTKRKGIFFVSKSDICRPEVYLHKNRLKNLNYPKSKKLLLLSLLDKEINELYDLFTRVKRHFKQNEFLNQNCEFWVLNDFFGIIPLQISEVFPLSQSVFVRTLTTEQFKKIIYDAFDYIRNYNFSEIILIGELREFHRLLMNYTHYSEIKKKIRGYGFDVSNSILSEIDSFIDFFTKEV